jgi:hypothetical protein
LRARRIASGRSEDRKKRNKTMDKDTGEVSIPAILNALVEVRGN